MIALVRYPTMMSSSFDRKTFEKRVQKDVKKLSKGFERINEESKVRGQKASEGLKGFFENLDKIAREDVEKVKTIFDETSIDVTASADYTEIDDIIIFKDGEDVKDV
jgi:archaellum component FlaC